MPEFIRNLLDRLRGDSYDLTAVVVELLLIGICVNWCVDVLRGTRGTRPLRGVLFLLVVATLVVRVLATQMGWVRLNLLYHYFLIGFAFIAVVVFQPELRRAIIRVGDVRILRRGSPQSLLISALVSACGQLSKNRHGALFAIERTVDLRGWAENGTILNAEVSANLLTSIFFPNSPLHDLGVIIRGAKVLAANCQFPSAESDEVDLSLGSRHLAALGMSYETDALVLVVSEETGVISLADNGQLVRFLSLDDLSVELTQRLSGASARPPGGRRAARSFSGFWKSARRWLVVLPLTLAIWYLADQATLTQTRVPRLELRLQHNQPTRLVGITEPTTPVFSVVVRGSTRAIDRLRSEGGETVAIDAFVTDAPGAYQRSVRDVLDAAPYLRQRGLNVLSAAPESIAFSVDEVVTVPVRVEVIAGSRRIEDVRVEPPEVSVTLRRGDLERLGENARLTLTIEERLHDLPDEGALTLEHVGLPDRIGGFPIVTVEPREVRVWLEVVGQRITRRIAGVGVRIMLSASTAQRSSIHQQDPNEWLIDVEVAGDPARVENLRPQDLIAFVPLSSEDIRPATDTEFRVKEVILQAPDGVTVIGPPRRVHLRLVAREEDGL